METFGQLADSMRREFRTFRVIPKDRSWLMRAIYYGLLTFLWCPGFLDSYTTVLVTRVYMPRHLIGTRAGWLALRHERIHMRDCLRSGVLPFVISYLFLLPAVFTLRAVWEMRAYTETMRAEHEQTGTVSDATLDHIARQFTSPAYLWMCPFPGLVRRWLRRRRNRVLAA